MCAWLQIREVKLWTGCTGKKWCYRLRSKYSSETMRPHESPEIHRPYSQCHVTNKLENSPHLSTDFSSPALLGCIPALSSAHMRLSDHARRENNGAEQAHSRRNWLTMDTPWLWLVRWQHQRFLWAQPFAWCPDDRPSLLLALSWGLKDENNTFKWLLSILLLLSYIKTTLDTFWDLWSYLRLGRCRGVPVASSSQSCCLVAGYKDLQGPFHPSVPYRGSCPAWTPQKKKGAELLLWYDDIEATHWQLTCKRCRWGRRWRLKRLSSVPELLLEMETKLKNAGRWAGGTLPACCPGF